MNCTKYGRSFYQAKNMYFLENEYVFLFSDVYIYVFMYTHIKNIVTLVMHRNSCSLE